MALNVVVTGATGFLGGHLTRLLVRRGHDVRAVYRDPDRLPLLNGSGAKPVRADIEDVASLVDAFRGADQVFHTAGYVGSRASAWAVNALAPRLVVQACAQAGVGRVIHTSSVVAVGPSALGSPADEDALYRGGALDLTYVDSKREGEVEALLAGGRLDVDVVVANPAYVVGVPHGRTLADASSAGTLVSFLHGGMPAIVGGLTNVVDVRDVAEGHALTAERGRPGERYILGGTNTAWVDVVQRLVERSPRRALPAIVVPPELARVAHAQHLLGMPSLLTGGLLTRLAAPSWQYSSAKAAGELGYRHRPLDDTLDEVIAWAEELRRAGQRLSGGRGSRRGAQVLGWAGRARLLDVFKPLERRWGRPLVVGR